MTDNLNDWLKGNSPTTTIEQKPKTPQQQAVDYALKRVGAAILLMVAVYLIMSHVG